MYPCYFFLSQISERVNNWIRTLIISVTSSAYHAIFRIFRKLCYKRLLSQCNKANFILFSIYNTSYFLHDSTTLPTKDHFEGTITDLFTCSTNKVEKYSPVLFYVHCNNILTQRLITATVIAIWIHRTTIAHTTSNITYRPAYFNCICKNDISSIK